MPDLAERKTVGGMTDLALPQAPRVPQFVSAGALFCAALFGGYYVVHQSEDLLNISLVGTGLTVVMVMALRRIVGRRMSVAVMFSGFWVAYFSIRMLVIQVNPYDNNLYPGLRGAPRSEFMWTWMMIVGGLAAFVVGVWWARPWRATRLVIPQVSDRLLFAFGTGALALRLMISLGRIPSGLAENVTDSYLIMLTALTARSITTPALARRAKMMLGLAVFAGYLSGYKEQAVVPLLAYMVGRVAGGHKIKPKSILVGFLIGITVFVSIQGARIAGEVGDATFPPPDPITVLSKYNMESGNRLRAERSTGEALVDVGRSLSRRFGGADALILLHRRAGKQEPYQHGKTIWQSAISILPGIASFIHLDFPVLSLGHWFSDHYVTTKPGEDPSSQAITIPGDLYLNFGTLGLLIGTMLLGLMYGGLDRLFPPNSPLLAGFAFYVGYPLIGLERNLAYPLVGTFIRFTVVLLLLSRFKMIARLPGNRRTRTRSLPVGRLA